MGFYGLPELTEDQLASVQSLTSTEPAVIREVLDFIVEDLSAVVEQRAPNFTSEQIFTVVMEAVRKSEQVLIFIDARGGCGKTFLPNTILKAEPGGCAALAMATTRIAAKLLELSATEESTLHISAYSSLAKLIRISKLLMIDEATMLDRYLLEAMDRTFRDLMSNPDIPFGRKVIILAGDFRQCLPVVPGATRPGTIQHCINQSPTHNDCHTDNPKQF